MSSDAGEEIVTAGCLVFRDYFEVLLMRDEGEDYGDYFCSLEIVIKVVAAVASLYWFSVTTASYAFR